MPTWPVTIKDILIQGTGGQRILRLLSSTPCGLLRMKDRPTEQESEAFDTSRYILTDSDCLYYDKPNKTFVTITR